MKRSMLVRLLLVAIALAMLEIPSAAQDKGAEVTAKVQIDTLKGFIHYGGGLDPCMCSITGYMTQGPSAGSLYITRLSGIDISGYLIYMNKLVRVIGQRVDCIECTKLVALQIEESYVQGDVNYDGIFDISDIVYTLDYIFSGGPAPVVMAAGDIDCSGLVDIGDVVVMVQYMFLFIPWPECQ
jgi:hypothetical protein